MPFNKKIHQPVNHGRARIRLPRRIRPHRACRPIVFEHVRLGEPRGAAPRGLAALVADATRRRVTVVANRVGDVGEAGQQVNLGVDRGRSAESRRRERVALGGLSKTTRAEFRRRRYPGKTKTSSSLVNDTPYDSKHHPYRLMADQKDEKPGIFESSSSLRQPVSYVLRLSGGILAPNYTLIFGGLKHSKFKYIYKGHDSSHPEKAYRCKLTELNNHILE